MVSSASLLCAARYRMTLPVAFLGSHSRQGWDPIAVRALLGFRPPPIKYNSGGQFVACAAVVSDPLLPETIASVVERVCQFNQATSAESRAHGGP
jgi:hypothetical protein